MIGPMQPRVASFIGWSNTGKTGFIEAALMELQIGRASCRERV